MKAFTGIHLALAIILLSVGAFAKESPNSTPHTIPFFKRFGYRLMLTNFNSFDSNVLRLNSTLLDFSGGLFPSVIIEYPLTSSTKLLGKYRLGIDRFASSSFLNTTSHFGLLSLTHKFTPQWVVELYDIFEHTNQPDVLLDRSRHRFASYAQNRVGLKVQRVKNPTTTFSFEYYARQRLYTGFYVGPNAKQEDVLHSVAFGWSHLFAPSTFGYVQVGYRINISNNPLYRYSEPLVEGYFLRGLCGGFQLQLYDRLGAKRFSERPVSSNAALSRSDVINTAMVGIKKDIRRRLAVNARYYYQRDFSNEPLRKFTDHTVTLGLELSFGKSASYLSAGTKEAVESSEMPIRMPEQPTAQTLTNLGYTYLFKGEYDKSLEYSLKAIELDFRIAEAHTNAGIAYYKKGMRSDAIREWSYSLTLNPTNEKVKSLLEKAKAEQ